MKRLFMAALILMALSLMAASVAFGIDVLQIKTGLNFIEADKVQPGYVAWRSNSWKGGSVVLIDMYGNLVHDWDCDGWKGQGDVSRWAWPQMTEDAGIVVSCEVSDNSMADAITDSLCIVPGAYDSLIEFDWDGGIVFDSGTSLYAANISPHHDWRKMWNNQLQDYTYMALVCQAYGAQDAVALGCDPVYAGDYANGWSPDAIVEVNQENEIIWRWSFADHLVQNYDPSKTGAFVDAYGYPNPGATYGEAADHPELLNINWRNDFGTGPEKDWTHCNSLDFNKDLGHVVINAKNMSECYIIDHDGTFVSTEDFEANRAAAQGPGGDFLHRFGNPAAYDQGDAPGFRDEGSHQMFGAHNVQWIGQGNYLGFDTANLPGNGNLLIFDNACWNPNDQKSVIIEWNPYIADADGTISGSYVNPPDAGYRAAGGFNNPLGGYSNQVVWKYEAASTGFYSSFISSCQRMPNGNTLIDSGGMAHFFEVTESGQEVWEYFTPDSPYLTDRASFAHSTFRCVKLPADHPGLADKDLTPKGNLRQLTIEQQNSPSASLELQKFLGTL